MSVRNWGICILASLLTLACVILVMAGVQAVVIDTGRAILH